MGRNMRRVTGAVDQCAIMRKARLVCETRFSGIVSTWYRVCGDMADKDGE